MKEAILRLVAAIAEYILIKSDPSKQSQSIHNAEYRTLRKAALMAHYFFDNHSLLSSTVDTKKRELYERRCAIYKKKFYAYIAKE
jgi:hypothetical protein